ncbi:MAG: hypothetical protein JXC85_04490 [Candidatus Aenigmarchaeota archaeon]|nr:hypothetical protein [Candidatus Aenigmarchaeota archaeon]
METQETTDLANRKTNALASRDLANIVLSGAQLCQPAETVAVGVFSPELEEIERRRAEKSARRDAARRAKEAAARGRAEEARRREEAAEIRRQQRISEIGYD